MYSILIFFSIFVYSAEERETDRGICYLICYPSPLRSGQDTINERVITLGERERERERYLVSYLLSVPLRSGQDTINERVITLGERERGDCR